MPKIPIIKAKDFYKYILKYNCEAIGIKGSHHRVMNPRNNQVSVIAIHGGRDLAPPLFAKTLKDLGIDIDDFLAFMENN